MAHTHCLLRPVLQPAAAPNEPLCSCHATIPSIPVVTIPATALYADFPWSGQGSRGGIWERMGSQCHHVPMDGGKDGGEQLVFLASTPSTRRRGPAAHYL